MPKQNLAFAVGQTVVHPVHGVGTISDRRAENLAGYVTDVYIIQYLSSSGINIIPVKNTNVRPVGTRNDLAKVIEILKQSPKTRDKHWAIHAKRYEGRINSGSLRRIAEVIRDLHQETRTEDMSGRKLYEAAVMKLVEEAAIIWEFPEKDALEHLRKHSGRTLHHPKFITRQSPPPMKAPPTADKERSSITAKPDTVLYYRDKRRSVSIYKDAEAVDLDGERLDLRKTDFALFHLIYSRNGLAISTTVIADKLSVQAKTVRTRVSQLRTRLGYAQFVIETIPGGYRFLFP